MIGFIKGNIIGQEADQILLLAGHIGYEVLLDPVTMSRISPRVDADETVSLYVYYHVTERQPKPVLIGFLDPLDKAFFQLFITVSAIGPMKAIKALTQPVSLVARAIEEKDIAFLAQLSGIGKRTAEKIVATLHGKVSAFADGADAGSLPAGEEAKTVEGPSLAMDVVQQVADVLTEQLGHSAASANRMIKEALDRNPAIDTPEDLFDEIYRENR